MNNTKEMLQALIDGKKLASQISRATLSLDDQKSIDRFLPYYKHWIIDDTVESRYHIERYTTNPATIIRGSFNTPTGEPIGLIVHFTAGHNDDVVDHDKKMLNDLAQRKLGVQFSIDYYGRILQTVDLNCVVYHAGKSYHEKHGHGLSDKFLGVEICNGGKLGLVETWFKRKIPEERRRTIKVARYAGEQVGTYEIYSAAQESALLYLIGYLKKEISSFKYLYGHDEIACDYKNENDLGSIIKNKLGMVVRGRKDDPGGALSIGMDELRNITGLLK